MIDFIYNIILGFDYPGLQKALDPVTIAMLVGQGVKYAGAQKQQSSNKLQPGLRSQG